ncbi:type II secretion system F family protein [Phyllobacterium endophyticum]|jgi:tight adherence protein C|uniref:Type II secretion system protein n=1 Tax=Phyllobacterium endophyticum TaxID=1149773 RepID=A0A2P7B0G4_9HYPH|nr:type II secretion system F family protein [Phyllobacterium endophyticum]MBB3235337.1 tight adherence protein C [Phyllobacterium endophyticum]PSH59976.1 type II secretion system protein [Phyllobacterium endophyticum]TYR42147.1 type II secretion system F family protein [Phyllobacterium endophyticum]
MVDAFAKAIQDPAFLFAILVGVSIFATLVTFLMPMLSGAGLKSRMKSVALERDQIRSRERARLASESDNRRKNAGGSLRMTERQGVRQFVERLDLQRALADEKTLSALRMAGFRGQNALNIFLAARFGLPFVTLGLAVFYIFGLGGLADKSTLIRLVACFAGAYVGFYLPNLYVRNVASKRKQSIQEAWPDALDLMLICVESGMSIEAAFKKVSEEIGVQSGDLAEELVLTNAELSFLPERRQAYDNLAIRTGLETVKSVVQALVQSERYGTSIGSALRVLSDESREMRLMAAEKKAAALPPKLTVPMILFLLPVLFCVILGPAVIQIQQQGGIFGPATTKK